MALTRRRRTRRRSKRWAPAGAVVFVFLTVTLEVEATLAALAAIVATFVFRVLTIVFNWRTTSLGEAGEDDVTP